jgi:drug/metabolite transporter (DMT)-like permease
MELKLNNTLWTRILLIAPFFLWGTAMVAMKQVIPHTNPLFLAAVRLIPAGFLVLLVAALQKRPFPQGKRAWVWILLFALMDASLFQGFLAQGLARTGAGLGSVIIDSQPLAVALLSSWLFSEVIGFWGWLGLSLGITGISLIGLPDEWFIDFFSLHGLGHISLSFTSLWETGEGLMLLASLSMAVGTVMIRYVSRYADPLVATGWHLIIGGLPLLFCSLGSESFPWLEITPADWLNLSYATIFGSAIAYGVFFYLASQGNLTSLSSLTFLTPIFALTFGNLFLGEVLSPLQWCGVSLTLMSIYLINQREKLPSLVQIFVFLKTPEQVARTRETFKDS